MIVKFSGKEIENIVRNHLYELLYGACDMEVDITVPADTEVVCWVTTRGE